MNLTRWLILLSISAVAACSSAAETPSPAPTITLIPATATPTATPLPPTPSLAPGVQPQDLFPTPATMQAENTPEALIDQDPIAAELVAIAQREVAESLDLPLRRVRLIEIEPYVWSDASLGCPRPGQSYAAVESYGYRIIIGAGNEEYIFHTDFDRVLPCEAGREQLPTSGTAEATPEMTDEATADVTPETTPEATAESA